MNVIELGRLTELPETHRLIVGDYQGAYSLGVTNCPPGFILRVQSRDTNHFPQHVLLQGQDIPVTVTGGFTPPQPMST